eukprot:jgi/Mesen1/3752/ME000205S03015
MGTTLQSDDGYVQHDKASLLACPSPTAPTTVSAPAAPLMPPSASSAPPPRPVNSQVPGRVQIYAPKSNVVSDFLRNKYEKDAWKYWDYFYKRNADRGQNDSEPASAPESAPSRGGPQPQVLLEVGCGAGNTVYPLLEANPNARVYACDFSKRAVELVQEHAEFAKNRERLTAFVCDITSDELAESVPPASVDAVTMVFVLSAISPEKMPAVVRNLAQVLKINEVRIGRQAQEQGQGQGQEDGQGGHVLKIKSLPKHDQHTQPSTGLLLWDSARALGSVLAAHPSLLAGRSVLELGCGGAAIASFLASKSARKIVATDGDPKALDLLEENLALNRDEFPVDRIQYQQLRWGDAEDIENARTLSDGAGFDVILGADVVYVAEAVPLLFQTSKMLLAGLPSGAGLIPLLILCHITRRVSEGEILSEATKAGLRHVSNDVLESYLHSPLDAEISAHFGNLGQEKTGLLRLLAFQVER